MHGDASYIRHNSGTQQQQAPSLNSVEKAPTMAFSFQQVQQVYTQLLN